MLVFKFFLNQYVVIGITFIILFFIPIMSLGYYYEVRYLGFLFNKTILIVVIATMMIISMLTYFNKSFNVDTHLLIFIGIGMILFNFSLWFFNIEANFFITGFVLLLAPLIKNLTMKDIDKILSWYAVVLIIYAVILFFDIITGSTILPIYEVRYFTLASNSDGLRLAFNSLFGQKNAAGATLSILGMLLIFLSLDNKKIMFLLGLGIGVIIFLTNSTSGILVYGIFLLLVFFEKTKRILEILFSICYNDCFFKYVYFYKYNRRKENQFIDTKIRKN